jgi:hypothetical protein
VAGHNGESTVDELTRDRSFSSLARPLLLLSCPFAGRRAPSQPTVRSRSARGTPHAPGRSSCVITTRPGPRATTAKRPAPARCGSSTWARAPRPAGRQSRSSTSCSRSTAPPRGTDGPDLEHAGYQLAVREPDRFEQRALKPLGGGAHSHMVSAGCPETERMVRSGATCPRIRRTASARGHQTRSDRTAVEVRAAVRQRQERDRRRDHGPRPNCDAQPLQRDRRNHAPAARWLQIPATRPGPRLKIARVLSKHSGSSLGG